MTTEDKTDLEALTELFRKRKVLFEEAAIKSRNAEGLPAAFLDGKSDGYEECWLSLKTFLDRNRARIETKDNP